MWDFSPDHKICRNTYKKRLLALFLDVLKLRNFQDIVKNDANSRCLMDMFILLMASARALAISVLIHIQREASACLLVLLYRAMRRPQDMERAIVRLSRFLFLCRSESLGKFN